MNAQFINNVLLGYDGRNPEPFIAQPTWPDGTPWANEAQALAWFDVLKTALQDDKADLPGNNPSEHPVKRPATTK